MLQHIHDIAPGASLAFRTGFVSEGDFAQGIYALLQDSCNIIADDVTYITAPFFKDGLAAKAVDYVKSKGVSYFSAAGNFANKAYESTFRPAAVPAGLTGYAHDFGGGDIFQNDSFKNRSLYDSAAMGRFDLFFRAGRALNDLDIYLANDDGSIRFGMNKFNAGGDPIEVLPFFVTADTKTNIIIVKASGPTTNVRFKLIVFRGELKFNEFESGTSTLVGQANAAGAMAVGAARYSNTPAFGVTTPVLESFSSIGGTPVYGVTRKKPDFIAPDGGNTSVNFSSLNIDGDLFPNFFGTSAAAPHAAGAAALVLEGKKKFYNKALEPDSVRYMLSHTSLDMATIGFDYATGSGLIQADSALALFAAPTPQLNQLILPDSLYVPGKTSFTLKLKGDFFRSNSTLMLRGHPIPTVVLSSTEATANYSCFYR
jgi:subtilisin family serine protease